MSIISAICGSFCLVRILWMASEWVWFLNFSRIFCQALMSESVALKFF